MVKQCYLCKNIIVENSIHAEQYTMLQTTDVHPLPDGDTVTLNEAILYIHNTCSEDRYEKEGGDFIPGMRLK